MLPSPSPKQQRYTPRGLVVGSIGPGRASKVRARAAKAPVHQLTNALSWAPAAPCRREGGRPSLARGPADMSRLFRTLRVRRGAPRLRASTLAEIQPATAPRRDAPGHQSGNSPHVSSDGLR
jgi:hypothetical protein